MPELQPTSFTVEKYPSLNGLRAISILLVLLHHLKLQYAIIPSFILNYFPILTDGSLGVNIFFVISGFLITSLLLKEEAVDKRISLKHFYTRRILRIFPAYYFLLLVYFILNSYGYIHISGQSWLTALTYTKYFNWSKDWCTAHAWSLSVEEHFYILWPLIFMAGRRIRNYFIFASLLIVPALRIWFYYNPEPWANGLTIFYRLDAIATGCCCAIYKDKLIGYFTPHWKKIFYGTATLLFLLPFFNLLNDDWNLHLDNILIAFGGTYGTIANILIACLVLFSVFGPTGQWFRLLNTNIMNRLGVLSYSIYLWQQLFIDKTAHFFNRLPFNLLFIFTAALLSYYLIEKPFLRLKMKFSTRKKEKTPVSTTPVFNWNVGETMNEGFAR